MMNGGQLAGTLDGLRLRPVGLAGIRARGKAEGRGRIPSSISSAGSCRSSTILFGNIECKDADKIRKLISKEIPAKVGQDEACQNAMRNSDRQNARVEHDRALWRVTMDLLADHPKLFGQFSDNEFFRK